MQTKSGTHQLTASPKLRPKQTRLEEHASHACGTKAGDTEISAQRPKQDRKMACADAWQYAKNRLGSTAAAT